MTTSSPSASAMRVAQTGTPRTKFFVPSMGSMIQRRDPVPASPNSSPTMASRVRARASCARMNSSAPRSASDTGVWSGFVSTCRSSARNRDIVRESTWSAMTCARRRSSSYVRPCPCGLEVC